MLARDPGTRRSWRKRSVEGCELVEAAAQTLLSERAGVPCGGRLRVVAQREDQPAQLRMLGTDSCLPLGVAPLVLAPGRGARRTGINGVGARRGRARDATNGLGCSFVDRLAASLERDPANAARPGVPEPHALLVGLLGHDVTLARTKGLVGRTEIAPWPPQVERRADRAQEGDPHHPSPPAVPGRAPRRARPTEGVDQEQQPERSKCDGDGDDQREHEPGGDVGCHEQRDGRWAHGRGRTVGRRFRLAFRQMIGPHPPADGCGGGCGGAAVRRARSGLDRSGRPARQRLRSPRPRGVRQVFRPASMQPLRPSQLNGTP